jgi:hypothetical protein
MHPALWGPFIWTMLHALVNVPQTPHQATLMASFLSLLQALLPCKVCRESFHDILHVQQESLRRSILQGNYTRWVFDLHRYVTHKLLREQYKDAGVEASTVSALLKAHDDVAITFEQVKERSQGASLLTPHVLFMCVGILLCCARTVGTRRCVIDFINVTAEIMGSTPDTHLHVLRIRLHQLVQFLRESGREKITVASAVKEAARTIIADAGHTEAALHVLRLGKAMTTTTTTTPTTSPQPSHSTLVSDI